MSAISQPYQLLSMAAGTQQDSSMRAGDARLSHPSLEAGALVAGCRSMHKRYRPGAHPVRFGL